MADEKCLRIARASEMTSENTGKTVETLILAQVTVKCTWLETHAALPTAPRQQILSTQAFF
jgi:hypothetical protein